MPQVMPKGFDPFKQTEPRGTVMPKGFDPFKRSDPTFVSPDGVRAIRSIFPQAKVTSGHRTNNVGPADDWHHKSNAAVDIEPIPGMSFDQFTGKLKQAGYPIVQQIDEVKHPSRWSTGPHWHVVLGARRTVMPADFDPFKPPKVMPKGFDPFKSPPARGERGAVKDTAQPRNRSPAAPSAAVDGNPGLGEALFEGFKNAPHEAVDIAKHVGRDVAHPIRTAGRVGNAALEAVEHPVDTVRGGVKSALDYAGGAMVSGMDALGIPGATARGKAAEAKFKQNLIHDPIGNAVMLLPAGRLVGKLGLRGVEAYKLKDLSPEARAALRAKRIEDAQAAKRYKDVARPIMAQHRLDTERATADLRKHQKTIGNLSPEEQRKIAIAADTGDRTGIAPEHHAALDTLRDVAKRYEKRIRSIYAAGGHNLPEFVENYYKHWWHPSTTKGELDEFLKKRQGSSASLKHRSIPTLAEGIEAGLRPRYENPLDTMTHYAHQISGHLVNHDLMNAMRKDPILGAKWVPKRAVPDGYRKLEGIGTEREGRGISKDIEGQQVHTGNVPPMVLAAKDAAARLYNRRVTKGLTETVNDHFGPKAAKVAAGVQKGAHGLISMKLFSAFHPTLIAGKSVASELGNGIRHLTRFAPVSAVKAMAHMPFAPALTAYQGFRMGKRLLKGDEAMTAMDKLYRDAGGSVRTGTAYKNIDSPSYLDSALRGTLKTDLKKSLSEAKSAPLRGALKMAGKAIDGWNDIVFKHYVPAIKRGAFERELATSLKAHPEWTEAQQQAEARRVFSGIEGRMGEMTRDTMFWSNMGHDLGRMIFLSPSWQIGNARMIKQAAEEIPESMRDLMKGKGITQGPAQMAGLLGSYMIGNAVVQYLYTGQKPQDIHDLLAARTGGTNAKDGTPERVQVPSVMKELYEYFTDPLTELSNVLNPSVKAAHELATNRDWRDDPIFHPSDADWQPNDPSRVEEGAGYVAQTFMPIPFGDNPNGENSKVGALSAFAGLRPVGTRWANPEKYEQNQRYFANKAMQARRRHEAKDKAAKRKR